MRTKRNPPKEKEDWDDLENKLNVLYRQDTADVNAWIVDGTPFDATTIERGELELTNGEICETRSIEKPTGLPRNRRTNSRSWWEARWDGPVPSQNRTQRG